MHFLFICGIIVLMYKSFYTSGLLYHLPTQQILLQQFNNLDSFWSLFGQEGQNDEDPVRIFQKAISQQLHIKLALESIYPVYDYFNKGLGGNCYVFYAQVDLEKKEFPKKDDYAAEWFTFKQATKLSFSDQLKRDIIVAERVIKAKARDDEAILFSTVAS